MLIPGGLWVHVCVCVCVWSLEYRQWESNPMAQLLVCIQMYYINLAFEWCE